MAIVVTSVGNTLEIRSGARLLDKIELKPADPLSGHYILRMGDLNKVSINRDVVSKRIYTYLPAEKARKAVDSLQHGVISVEMLIAPVVEWFALGLFRKNQLEDRFFKECDPKKRASVVNEAAASGHIDLLQFLLSKWKMSEQDKGFACISAASAGQIEVLKILLRSPSFFSQRFFSANRYGYNVDWVVTYGGNAAARWGEVEVLKFLFSKGLPESSEFAATVKAAAAGGHLEALEFLFSQKTLTSRLLGEPIIAAVAGRHLGVLPYLFYQEEVIGEEIADRDFDKAVVQAADRGGNMDILRFLFRIRMPSENGKVMAVGAAAIGGNLEIVEFLLSQMETTDFHSLIWNAAVHGHVDLVRFLLSRGGAITITELSAVIISTSARGYYEIVGLLLPLGPITQAAKDEAVEVASGEHAQEIRDLLQGAQIASVTLDGNHVDPQAVEVSFPDIRQNPENYLRQVCSFSRFPYRIRDVKSSSTIDLGGVTRQYVSLLMESLVEQKKIPLTKIGLPMIRNESRQSDSEMMKNLGRFCSLLAEANIPKTIPATIGAVFSPPFYEIVCEVADASSSEQLLKTVASIVAKVDPSCAEARVILAPEENIASYAQHLEIEGEEAYEHARQSVTQYIAAAQSYYDSATDWFKATIQNMEPKSLCIFMQGREATVAALMKALKINPQNRNPVFLQRIKWIKESIQKSDEQWRKRFVQAITGSTSLALKTEIEIRESEKKGDERFTIFTCFGLLKIPVQKAAKEDFLYRLNDALTLDFTNK